MLEIKKHDDYIFNIKISLPRLVEDESEFLKILNNLLTYKRFGLIIEVQGEASFSKESKKQLALWFKENKNELRMKCVGFIRIVKHINASSKLSSKAMRLAIPCPYEVCTDFKEAKNWFQKNIHLSTKKEVNNLF